MVSGRAGDGTGTAVCDGRDEEDGVEWVEIGAVDVAHMDDLSVAGGGVGSDMDAQVANSGGTESEKMAGVIARRHAHGFAVLRMFPMIEIYLLHVYVLLQLALFGP